MELLGMDLLAILMRIDEFIWGPPLLVLLVRTGFFLTWRLGMIQVFRLPLAIRYVLNSRKAEVGVQGNVSSFAAHSTALSATIMAIPNLIALLALRKIIVAETRQYFQKLELKNLELKN